jgi:predicted site-specific integrase-resolvase
MLTHMTTTEVADRLQISPRTLERWRLDPQNAPLPWIYVGRVVRYRLSDIEEYERRQTRGTPAPLAPYAGKHSRY